MFVVDIVGIFFGFIIIILGVFMFYVFKDLDISQISLFYMYKNLILFFVFEFIVIRLEDKNVFVDNMEFVSILSLEEKFKVFIIYF